MWCGACGHCVCVAGQGYVAGYLRSLRMLTVTRPKAQKHMVSLWGYVERCGAYVSLCILLWGGGVLSCIVLSCIVFFGVVLPPFRGYRPVPRFLPPCGGYFFCVGLGVVLRGVAGAWWGCGAFVLPGAGVLVRGGAGVVVGGVGI